MNEKDIQLGRDVCKIKRTKNTEKKKKEEPHKIARDPSLPLRYNVHLS